MSRQTLPQQQQLFQRAALAAALALSAVACAKDVPTGAQPCPCADGYVCCQSGVCAQGQDSCDEATSALSAQAVGQWTGYIENYTGLASGADTLTLSFRVADDGTLQGSAKLGDATPPAPPTDPKVPWPPGITYDNAGLLSNGPWEGFAYTAHALKWEARRLKFDVYFAEPWKPWCELQTSYMTTRDNGPPYESVLPPPWWTCTPNGSWSPSPSDATMCQLDGQAGGESIPCLDFALCSNYGDPCVCDSKGCTVPMTSPSVTPVASFDIALTGDSGDGSMALGNGVGFGQMNNVRLVHASH
jgi:hypothetical protein